MKTKGHVTYENPNKRALLGFGLAFWGLTVVLVPGGPWPARLFWWTIVSLLSLPPALLAMAYVTVRDDYIVFRNFWKQRRLDRVEISGVDMRNSFFSNVATAFDRDGSKVRLRAIDGGNGLSRTLADLANTRVEELREWQSQPWDQ